MTVGKISKASESELKIHILGACGFALNLEILLKLLLYVFGLSLH